MGWRVGEKGRREGRVGGWEGTKLHHCSWKREELLVDRGNGTIIPGNSNKEEIEKGKFHNSHQLEISPSSSTTQPPAKVQKEMFTAEVTTPGIPVLNNNTWYTCTEKQEEKKRKCIYSYYFAYAVLSFKMLGGG